MYASQEATVRILHETTDWFKIGKGVHQGCILYIYSLLYILYIPSLLNLNAEYIMRNAELGESQAGIKIARRNIKNLTYADEYPYCRK